MAEKLYYKLLSVKGQAKLSIVSEAAPAFWKRLALKYHPGKWRKPLIPNSKLYVFESLDAAKRFAERRASSNRCQIWSCKIKPSNECPSKADCPFTANEIKRFWANPRTSATADIAPAGTVFADAVMILEKVYDFRTEQ
jgi:hypothetical protein